MNYRLQILKIDTKEGVSRKSGLPYKISEAHSIIFNPDGTPHAVGVLVLPKALEADAKPGMFNAQFSLEAGTRGDDQGRILARIAALTAVTAAGGPGAAASKQ